MNHRDTDDRVSSTQLRQRALAQLGGRRADASAALGVLHALASQPATAADALALLHELQVHQVELDLQDEELRRARTELEQALARRTQLYECTPAACLSVDHGSVIGEVNAAAARLLGGERAALAGRRLDSFLAPRGADALHTLLARARDGHVDESCALQLTALDGTTRAVRAAAQVDPGSAGFLLALMDCGETAASHAQAGRE